MKQGNLNITLREAREYLKDHETVKVENGSWLNETLRENNNCPSQQVSMVQFIAPIPLTLILMIT